MTSSLGTWYPHYIGDYARKTAHLTVIEHGAYRLLLDHYYATGKPLDANADVLHRVCRAFADAERQAIDKVLRLFFFHDEEEGVYIHHRAEEELAKRSEISHKRRAAAERRHAEKNMQVHSKCDANAMQMHMQNACKDDAKGLLTTTTTTTTSTTTITDDNNQVNKGDARGGKKQTATKPDDVTDDTWRDYVTHRKAKRAPVTDTAINRTRTEAAKIGWTLEQALIEQCAQGWQGFKADWVNNRQNGVKENARDKLIRETAEVLDSIRVRATD